MYAFFNREVVGCGMDSQIIPTAIYYEEEPTGYETDSSLLYYNVYKSNIPTSKVPVIPEKLVLSENDEYPSGWENPEECANVIPFGTRQLTKDTVRVRSKNNKK